MDSAQFELRCYAYTIYEHIETWCYRYDIFRGWQRESSTQPAVIVLMMPSCQSHNVVCIAIAIDCIHIKINEI